MKKLIFALTLLFSILAVQGASAANLTWTANTPTATGTDTKSLNSSDPNSIDGSYLFNITQTLKGPITHSWEFNVATLSYVTIAISVLTQPFNQFSAKLVGNSKTFTDFIDPLKLTAGNYTLSIVMNNIKKPTGSTPKNPQEQISITSTALPVPAAIWLFGSAFLGLIGAARRKTVTPAI